MTNKESDLKPDPQKRDEVLKRMLKMKPQPHVASVKKGKAKRAKPRSVK